MIQVAGRYLVAVLVWMFVRAGDEASGANILMVPLASNSHAVMFGQLATGLVAEGHSVTILIPTNTKVPGMLIEKGVMVYRYQGEKEQFVSSQAQSEIIIKFALAEGLWDTLKIAFTAPRDQDPHAHWAADCEGLYNDTKLLQLLSSKHYDFAVLDAVYPPCGYSLAYKLDIPYASLSLAFMSPSFRVPHLSSQVPSLYTGTTDSMDFFQRLKNFFIDCLEFAITVNLKGNFVQKYAPEKKLISNLELVQRSKLWFYLYDPVLNFPRPRMPNVIFLGDLMAREAKPLSSDWEMIMSAKEGVILVSLGTMLEGMPEELINVFYDGLGQVRQTVVMKKAGFIPSQVSGNILLRNWVPQNDLLAHPNLKLFISHCGQNSIVEAAFHGKPVLGIPLAYDQPFNGLVVKERGIGKLLKLGKFDASQLAAEIEEMLSNSSYKDAAKMLSEAFRDKQQTAAQRASFWINHVLEHGDEHLRTKAFELNIAQFMMIDIYLFLLFVFTLFLILFYYCLRVSCRICHKCCPKRDKLKKA